MTLQLQRHFRYSLSAVFDCLAARGTETNRWLLHLFNQVFLNAEWDRAKFRKSKLENKGRLTAGTIKVCPAN